MVVSYRRQQESRSVLSGAVISSSSSPQSHLGLSLTTSCKRYKAYMRQAQLLQASEPGVQPSWPRGSSRLSRDDCKSGPGSQLLQLGVITEEEGRSVFHQSLR